jgi:hypothetical protein
MADVNAQVATNTPQDGTTPIPAVVAQAASTGGNGNNDKFEELLDQKRKANKEAVEERKRRETLEAELKAYKDREKTELQKLQDKADEALKTVEAERQARVKLERINIALQHNATDTEYIAWKLAQDKPEDTEKYLADMKKNSPFLFKQATQQSVPSAEGGPGSGKKNPKAEEISNLENAIKQETDARNQLFLTRKLKKLKSEV